MINNFHLIYHETYNISNPLSNADRADKKVIQHHHTDHHKEEVNKDHTQAQHLTDLPLAGYNGDDEKAEHKKEKHRGTDEPAAVGGHWSQIVNERVQEPRQRKTFMGKNTARERRTQTSIIGT